MNNLLRDKELKIIKNFDNSIYDLRIGNNHIEIASYNEINNKVKYFFNEKYYKINVNYLNNIKSLNYAIYLISNERYWEAHEVLENIWHEKHDLIKKTYQFIILLCVANIHKQRGHIKTYNDVIDRALKIETLDKIENINVKLLKDEFIEDNNYKINDYFKQLI